MGLRISINQQSPINQDARKLVRSNPKGRYLTEDRQKPVAHRQEVLGLPQVAEQLEGAVDHVPGARGDLGAAAEAGEMVADVAVVLFDREGQVLAGGQSFLWDDPLETLPVIRHEDIV